MAKENIIKELGEVLLHTKCDVNHILEVMSFSAKLESKVDNRYLFEYEMLDEDSKRDLFKLHDFKINETWSITDTDYISRIMADAKVYFIQLGLEYEALFDPCTHINQYLKSLNEGDLREKMVRLWSILPCIYYMVYKRIMSFAEHIPPMVDELIEMIHRDYKEEEYWGFTDQRQVEHVLFMYGILYELIMMINSENLIEGGLSESGERIEASDSLLKPELCSRELTNREKRLRRAAARKGLFIKKRKWRLYYSQYNYDSFDGYCVGTVETGLILWGENEVGINAPTLEEAEKIVANY